MFEKHRNILQGWLNNTKEKIKILECFNRLSGCEPKRVSFHLTFKCNLKCVMCELWRFGHEDENLGIGLSKDKIFFLFDELLSLGTKHIHFSGGEVTLRKDFIEILQRASSNGFDISLNTNGTTMTKSLATEIVNSNVSSVIFSLDSPLPESHDNIRRMPGSWEKTVRGIRNLGEIRNKLEKNIEIRINYVLMKENYRNADRLLDLCKKVSFESVFFIPVVNYNAVTLLQTKKIEKDFSNLSMDYNDIVYFNENILPVITKKTKHYGLNEDSINPRYLFGESGEEVKKYLELGQSRGFYEKNHCFIPFFSSEILPSGDVIPCCMSPLFVDKYAMGNVNRQPFSEIWNSEKYTEFRRKCRSPSFSMCKDCMAEYRKINEDMMKIYKLLKPISILNEFLESNNNVLIR